jgi:hypothetical protein
LTTKSRLFCPVAKSQSRYKAIAPGRKAGGTYQRKGSTMDYAAIVDELGALKAQIADLTTKEGKLK